MKVLFVCWGNTDGLSHWRSFVPARAMGADLVCFDGGREVYSSAVHKITDYDVAVVQTCWYEWQHKVIQRLGSLGIPVLLNVDDWIKGIGRQARSQGGALWRDFTDPEVLARHERILRECRGVLASTPVLADKLSTLNQVGLAPNGLDLHRYTPWRDPVRDDGFCIGWAGGVGHTHVVREIAPAVQAAVNDLNDQGIKAKLVVVGQDERSSFGLSPDQMLYLRWADKYIYPQYLSCFDVSLAPSRDDSFYKYKSQLRLYEGAALGTPTLGGQLYASEMDGFGVVCTDDWYDQIVRYATDPTMAQETRQFCYDNIDRFTIEERIGTWRTSIQNLLG